MNKCVLAFISIALISGMSSLPVQASQLDAAFSIDSDWGTGYQVMVTLTNPSSMPTTSWSASFGLEDGQEKISSLWSANYTINGTQVMVTNPSWMGGEVIPAHGTTTFGFVVMNAMPRARTLINLQASANGTVPTLQAPTLNAISSTGASSYNVSWSTVPGANSYTLQQSMDSGFTNPVVVAQGTDTSKSFANQASGTYYYRVFASNGTTNSSMSAVQSIAISSTPVTLQAPVLQAINNAGANSYQVAWNTVANAQMYVLEQSSSSNFSNPMTLVNSASTSYQVSGQAQGTYYYRVTASAGSSSSPASNIQSATVTQTPPPPSSSGAFVEGYWES